MRIVAVLSWYDEPIDWLRDCVASAARFCDHLIAVDGPYAAFPGADGKPFSPPEQAVAIAEAAGGMGCTLRLQRTSWASEVAKRDYMFRMAMAESADWVFRIDADEVVTQVPADLREQLACTARNVASATFMYEVTPGWPLAPSALRCLFRALPGIGVFGAHSRVVVPIDGREICLAGPNLEACEQSEEIEGLRMQHRSHERSMERQSRKRDYYELLPVLER